MIISKVFHRIRRFFNKYKLYSYPETNDGWIKIRDEIIENPCGSYFDPYYCKNNHSFYISNRKNDSISCFDMAQDYKLVNERCVFKGRKNEWDEVVNRACVVFANEKYYMWYTGQFDGKSCIGLSLSSDGINFNRVTNSPVLTANQSFEKGNVMNPCILYDDINKIFKMWYSAGDIYEPNVICYAESHNGIDWKKIDTPVLSKTKNFYDKNRIGGCDVIKKENLYYMFYIGYQNVDNARICVAISSDGINWLRLKNNPIISPSKGWFDSHACYKPCYVEHKGFELLLYNGRTNGDEYILACKR